MKENNFNSNFSFFGEMEFWRLNSNGMKNQASERLREQNTILTLILQLLNLTGKFTEQ